jgi:hypothetical protein
MKPEPEKIRPDPPLPSSKKRVTKVARWYIFKPKIPNRIFGGFAVKDVGIFFGHWVISRPLGIF